MKRGVKTRYLHELRPQIRQQFNRRQTVWLMQRCEWGQCVQARQHRRINLQRVHITVAAMHDAMAYRFKLDTG